LTRPPKSLVVCTTPRAGAGVLADLLDQTGVTGRSVVLHGDADALPATDVVLTLLTDHASFERLLARAEASSGEAGLDALWGTIGPPQFVWATRRDRVRQAISWWRARATGRWRSSDSPTGPDPTALDHDAVQDCMSDVVAQDAAWAETFAELGVVPMTLVYEDWTRRRDETLRRVLRALAIDIPAALPMAATGSAMADDATERWRAEVLAAAINRPARTRRTPI
jgi:LPS sulfotransferase NodH